MKIAVIYGTERKGCTYHIAQDVPANFDGAQVHEMLLWADLIVLTSPVFSYHVSGQMKVFLGHFANMWLVHHPEPAMFAKQGLIITAAVMARYLLMHMKPNPVNVTY